jgi:hypothetical protein
VSDHRLRLRTVLSQARIARFAAAAAGCTLLQVLILADLGMGKILANGLGFALSAQRVLRRRRPVRHRELRDAPRGARRGARGPVRGVPDRASGSKPLPDLSQAVLFGGSVAAVSYAVASDCVQFRSAS